MNLADTDPLLAVIFVGDRADDLSTKEKIYLAWCVACVCCNPDIQTAGFP
jgi:hypothetical protein